MLKYAVLENNVVRTFYFHCCRRTANPCLIIQRMIFRIPLKFRDQSIRIEHVHPGLQRYMPFLGRTQPGSIIEMDILETNMGYRSVSCPHNFHKCFRKGYNGRNAVHFFSGQGIIIKAGISFIEIPFARLVKQLHGIGDIKRRVNTFTHHWSRPGMFKLNPAFGGMKRYPRRIPVKYDRSDPQNSYLPHLMQYEFRMRRLRYPRYRTCRHPKNFVLDIIRNNPVHLPEIGNIPCPHGLSSVNPQLPEVNHVAVN
jgi:hypothetical protein